MEEARPKLREVAESSVEEAASHKQEDSSEELLEAVAEDSLEAVVKPNHRAAACLVARARLLEVVVFSAARVKANSKEEGSLEEWVKPNKLKVEACLVEECKEDPDNQLSKQVCMELLKEMEAQLWLFRT